MVRKRKRPRRPIIVRHVPGVSVPSTEKSLVGIKRSSLTIPEDLWHRAKVKALDKRMDLKDLIEEALEEYLDREEEPK